MANDILNPSVSVSMLSSPAADIARAAPKTPPVNQAPKREENAGRSFAEELARSPDRDSTRDGREAKVSRDSKDSAEKEKTLTGDQPKKATQSVKKAAAATKEAIDGTPSVAFISGRLDAIDPAKIPTIVTDTPFLSQALAQEDIGQFMAQPTSILNLVRNLGLPVTLLTEVQKFGIEPDQLMAPADFLKAIGVDPQQVAAELSMLKGNVLAEGMLPYLNRAQALTGKAQKTNEIQSVKLPMPKNGLEPLKINQESIQVVPDWTPALLANQFNDMSKDAPQFDQANLAAAAMMNAAHLMVGQQSNIAQPINLADFKQTDFEQSPLVKIEGARQETAVLANLVRQLTGQDQVEVAGTDIVEMQIAAQNGNPYVSSPTLSMERFAQISAEPRDGIVLDQPIEMPKDWRPENIVSEVPGALKKATFDAFAVMGEQMKGMDTVRFDVAKMAGEAANKAAADNSILYGINSPQNMVAQANSIANPLIAQSSGLDKTLSLDTIKEPLINRTTASEPANALTNVKEQLQVAGVAPSVQPRGETQTRQDTGSNNSQSQSQMNQEKSLNDVKSTGHQTQPTRTQPSGATFAQKSDEAQSGLSPQQRYQIMQKVLNHATMMVKEGGGTVRLDLGSSELGSMQMAINMNKDQVDMRVITSSDRVREAMMAELNQLKNALSVQNVRLGNVEVGVSGRQPNGFAAFDGNSNQGRGRNFSDRDRSSDGRGIQGIKGMARPQFSGPVRMDASGVSSLLNANGGKIAVRA